MGGASGREGRAAWPGRAVGALAELVPGAVARSTPAVLRAFLPDLARPLDLALTARLALSAALGVLCAALAATAAPLPGRPSGKLTP